jgi:hypothetical protein
MVAFNLSSRSSTSDSQSLVLVLLLPVLLLLVLLLLVLLLLLPLETPQGHNNPPQPLKHKDKCVSRDAACIEGD